MSGLTRVRWSGRPVGGYTGAPSYNPVPPTVGTEYEFYLGHLEYVWEDDDPAPYVLLDVCTYSHYSGSIVERANYQYLIEEYGDNLILIWGGHGTKSIAVEVDWLFSNAPRANELLDELRYVNNRYPVFDDDYLSSVEQDAIREGIESVWDYEIRDAYDDRFEEFPPDSLALAYKFDDWLYTQGGYWEVEDAYSIWPILPNGVSGDDAVLEFVASLPELD